MTNNFENKTITKVYKPVKTNASSGSWCINYNFIWDTGLKANGFVFTFYKKEATEAYNKLLKLL